MTTDISSDLLFSSADKKKLGWCLSAISPYEKRDPGVNLD